MKPESFPKVFWIPPYAGIQPLGPLWAAIRICPLVANNGFPDLATIITLCEAQQLRSVIRQPARR